MGSNGSKGIVLRVNVMFFDKKFICREQTLIARVDEMV